MLVLGAKVEVYASLKVVGTSGESKLRLPLKQFHI